MKRLFSTLALASMAAALLVVGSCSEDAEPQTPPTPSIDKSRRIYQLERAPFYDENPESRTPHHSIASEEHRLEFFGWGEQTDKAFTMTLPESVEGCDRVLLEYRMGGQNEGPGEWDYTTMLFVENDDHSDRYEIVRAITPYGLSFGGDWEKRYFIDVTEFLPLLRGERTFRLYYGGWDATDRRAHTMTITLHYYKADSSDQAPRQTLFIHKLYDSSRTGNSGYRAWCYGVRGHNIEDEERLGERTVEIPDEVKRLEMRVAITGHGHDQGIFPDRTGYRTLNAAEFDMNYYTFLVNDYVQKEQGYIFYDNSNNYYQAGTYKYDRANWAPGKPINLQYWEILADAPTYGTLTLDIDLERFTSEMSEPNAEGVAQYIVEVMLFGYDK